MALVSRGSGHGAGQQLYYAFKLKGSKTTAMCAGTTCTRLILTRTSDSTGRGHRRRMRAERCFDFSHVIINDDPQVNISFFVLFVTFNLPLTQHSVRILHESRWKVAQKRNAAEITVLIYIEVRIWALDYGSIYFSGNVLGLRPSSQLFTNDPTVSSRTVEIGHGDVSLAVAYCSPCHY